MPLRLPTGLELVNPSVRLLLGRLQEFELLALDGLLHASDLPEDRGVLRGPTKD